VSFPILFWTPYLTLYAHVSLAQIRFPTQRTFRHFTPTGRLFILMLLFLHQGWPSNFKSIPSTQLEEGPPPCIVGSSKTILPSYPLGRTWTFCISNYFRSNFVNLHVELNFDKANKEGSKETNLTWRVCNEIVEGGHCGRSWQEYSISNDFCQPFSFGIMLPKCKNLNLENYLVGR